MATPDDAPEVARLLHDFNMEFDTPSPGTAVLTSRLQRLLGEKSTFAILAGTPSVGVAVVTARPNVWYEGEVILLDELYVVPELRAQGIGSAMMTMLLSVARQPGADLLEVNVDEEDVDAQRFYVQHGLTLVDSVSGQRAFYLSVELS